MDAVGGLRDPDLVEMRAQEIHGRGWRRAAAGEEERARDAGEAPNAIRAPCYPSGPDSDPGYIIQQASSPEPFASC